MHPNIIRYKKEFTLYEIALIWAGVEVETAENRENVRSALRILLRALENLKLFSDWHIKQPDLDPKDLRDETGDYNFNGPWTRFLVTPQDLKEMFHRLGDPLPAWLIKFYDRRTLIERAMTAGKIKRLDPDQKSDEIYVLTEDVVRFFKGEPMELPEPPKPAIPEAKIATITITTPENSNVTKQPALPTKQTRNDYLSSAIKVALDELRKELKREPKSHEIFNHLAKHDKTNTIIKSEDNKLIWKNGEGKKKVTSRDALAERLSRRKKSG